MATFVGNSIFAHAKGGCYVCGKGDSLVDTDVQIEGEGALVLCAACIQTLAEAAGITSNEAVVQELRAELTRRSPEHIDMVEASRAAGVEAIKTLDDALAVANAKIDALTEALRPVPADLPVKPAKAPRA